MSNPIRVTVFNEFHHENHYEPARRIYPDGIHAVIAASLKEHSYEVQTATQDQPEHGLTEDVLNGTDVLVWWSHILVDEFSDEVVERIHRRILDGMGLIVLHSGTQSKLFKKLMGTSCAIKWREADEKERIWVLAPNHPIVAGVPEYFELPEEEMYGEFFDVPPPEELVLMSWFQGGEVFRSGITYTRGKGKIFVFRPGHESLPTYYNPHVQRIIANSVGWAAPVAGTPAPAFGNAQPLEPLPQKQA
ncbi:ThuA domain-containing protein [Cohnella sp. 56]|uniref:ThuA domain-containing protein n=1 Tax=Cohnella sp. 56 TaxID=3113722 RepID=UPI0030EA15D4